MTHNQMRMLKNFLKEHKVYNKFKKYYYLYCRVPHEYSLRKHLMLIHWPSDLILYAFDWILTPEGYNFWNSIHDKIQFINYEQST